MNTIGVIIPTYNRPDTLRKSLERLLSLPKNYLIYVIDDGLNSTNSKKLALEFSNVKYIEGTGDLWWSGSINRGMEFALNDACNVIVWMNDDCETNAEDIVSLSSLAANNTNAIFSPSYLCRYYDNLEKHPGPLKSDTFKYIDGFRLIPLKACSGQCVAFHSSILSHLGFIDTVLFPHYGDTPFTYIAYKSGISIYEVFSLKVKINYHFFRRIHPFWQILLATDCSNIVFIDYFTSKRSLWHLGHRLSWYVLTRKNLGYLIFIISFATLFMSLVLAKMLRRIFQNNLIFLQLFKLTNFANSDSVRMIESDILHHRNDTYF
jgi:GT2 family glycosyltransferase